MKFDKYEGAGNDFVFLDPSEWTDRIPQPELIRRLCDRRLGIGADGLIVLRSSAVADFTMDYYNADGMPGSFCGNGGRCSVLHASQLGWIDHQTRFEAFDGVHTGAVLGPDRFEVSMMPGGVPQKLDASEWGGEEVWFADTGSPHVVWVGELDPVRDWESTMKGIRHSPRFAPGGTNVNQVWRDPSGQWKMRTFERGVEAETLACGTGTVAVARVLWTGGWIDTQAVSLQALGGRLEVLLEPEAAGFGHSRLRGPAHRVYSGTWPLSTL
ncbi:diaminopimelate epimerase [bacterium]|nr:diaminopimelate epimerase [bacterium]